MKVLAEVCRCAGCVCLTGQDSHFEQKFSGVLVTSYNCRSVIYTGQFRNFRNIFNVITDKLFTCTCLLFCSCTVRSQTKLTDLPLFIADRRHSLLGHVCRLPPDVPAHNILQHCVNLTWLAKEDLDTAGGR